MRLGNRLCCHARSFQRARKMIRPESMGVIGQRLVKICEVSRNGIPPAVHERVLGVLRSLPMSPNPLVPRWRGR